ncbi:FAD-dependent oxidoreductase [Mucilaginibacter lacusdianchii]|uniref:FAD-dependent oxidoreductase n=1 Tax=Mucilaginibacter lacusdianchii TaxID=2684211 RepID=UPI00131DFD94|nr:NAD(P)/FAD-dependent oxidoreductase [Mucilaginibacter sp. JXJ CY 39]
MLLHNKKVAIIGAGPGGLTLARLLQMKGISVNVYERDFDEKARVQGATLDLHLESGLKAIKAAGLLEEFKKTYRPGADKGLVMDKYGNIIFKDDVAAGNEDFDSPYARPEIDRGPLRNLLMDSLLPGTVIWDSHLLSLEEDGDSWKLDFNNGTSATADILIGADGANSKVRSFVGSAKNHYAGTIIIQGNVASYPEMATLLNGGKIYVFADEKYLHVSSKGDDSIDFYISLKKEENWHKTNSVDFSDRNQLIKWSNQEFFGWSELWTELIARTNLPLLLRPQYCMPFNQSWEPKTNITVLGDAAHLMPPSGEGVNLAMLDALELSEALTDDSFKNIADAIAAYETRMQTRGIAEAQTSMEMVTWMHADEAQNQMVKLLRGEV